jgi:hypothetical protein
MILQQQSKYFTKGVFVVQQISENKSPSFYSVDDIQRLLGIGRNSAYKLVNSKDFPALYVGNRIIIPTDLFQNWVNQQSIKRKGGGINGKRPTG